MGDFSDASRHDGRASGVGGPSPVKTLASLSVPFSSSATPSAASHPARQVIWGGLAALRTHLESADHKISSLAAVNSALQARVTSLERRETLASATKQTTAAAAAARLAAVRHEALTRVHALEAEADALRSQRDEAVRALEKEKQQHAASTVALSACNAQVSQLRAELTKSQAQTKNLQRVAEKLAVKATTATEQLVRSRQMHQSMGDHSAAVLALTEKAKALYKELQSERRKTESLENIIHKSKRGGGGGGSTKRRRHTHGK